MTFKIGGAVFIDLAMDLLRHRGLSRRPHIDAIDGGSRFFGR
jgi:hypothetical protein